MLLQRKGFSASAAGATVLWLILRAASPQAQCVDYLDPGVMPAPVVFDLFPDGEVSGMEAAGDVLWLARSNYGALAAVDLSDPDRPALLGVEPVTVMDEVYDVDVSGGLGFLTYLQWGGATGVRVFDIADPAHPRDIGDFPAPPGRWASYLAARDGRLYVSFAYDLFAVLEVGDGSAPALLGQVPVDHPWDIVLAGDLAFVATGTQPVIIDVADPTAPEQVGTVPTTAHAAGLAVAGHLVYAATGAGLEIFDASVPAAVLPVGAVATPDVAVSVHLATGVAYVGVRDGGVHVFDVRDQASPAARGIIDVPGIPWGLATDGDRLLVNSQSRLHIVPRQCDLTPTGVRDPGPAGDLNLAMSPNPSNPGTEISFELPAAARTTLLIHDLAGRRVSTLAAAERLPAGRHRIVWRGVDDRGRAVPSGVYIGRLEVGPRVEARRLTLLR